MGFSSRLLKQQQRRDLYRDPTDEEIIAAIKSVPMHFTNRTDNFQRTAVLAGATPSDGGSAWVDTSSSYSTGFDSGSGDWVAFVSGATPTTGAWLDTAVTDGTLTVAIVHASAGNQMGIISRVVDANNYYYFFADGTSGSTSLYKNVAGTFTQLGTTGSQTWSVGQTLGLSCIGSTITGYVNGVQSNQATDSSLTTGTKVGLRTTGSSFPFYANFSFTAPAVGGGLIEEPFPGLPGGIMAT